MKVLVEEYNPAWATQFQDIKCGLEKILEGMDFISIEHVGSTSVPGLAAKPVLDIDIVAHPRSLESIRMALVELGGYEYMGDWGIPDRYVFRKPSAIPRRNLCVCIEGCQSLRNHLLVRDICRRDASVRQAYGQRKLELAQGNWVSVDEYCEAKTQILQYVLEKAGMDKDDRSEIQQRNSAATR